MRFDLSQSGLKSVITAGIFSLVAIGILFNWAVPVSAQNAAPAKPDAPTLRALHQGMVEVDWNDVSGANRYEVQFYTSSGWIDLPNAGLGIEIFFDGSRAEATGLPADLGYDAFHVRAGNSVGWSEWSEYAWQMTTHNMDWEGIPATGAPTISGTAQVGETLTTVTVTRSLHTVTIAAEYPNVGAGIEDLVFILTRTSDVMHELDVTVRIQQDQPWLADSDLSHTVTFMAGSATATLTLDATSISLMPDATGNLTATAEGTNITGDSDTVEMISIATPPITVSYDNSRYTFAENAALPQMKIYALATLDPIYPRAPSRSFSVSFSTKSASANDVEDFAPIDWQAIFVNADYESDGDKFIASKRLQDNNGDYFAVVNDEVYEGSTELLYLQIQRFTDLTPDDLVRFAYPDGTTCVQPCSDHEVSITDSGDQPVLSLNANPTSISEEDDSTTSGVAENVSILTVSAASPKTFSSDKTIKLVFTGTATYGTRYTVSPADTDSNATGHQVTLPALSPSVQVTITAASNDNADGNKGITATGSLGGRVFGSENIGLPDDDLARTTDIQRVNSNGTVNTNTTVAGLFKVRINFMPSATGLLERDLEVKGGTIDQFVSGDISGSNVWYVDILPDQGATSVTVRVLPDVVDGGNPAAEVIYSAEPPLTLVFTTNANEPVIAQFLVSVTFSADVTALPGTTEGAAPWYFSPQEDLVISHGDFVRYQRDSGRVWNIFVKPYDSPGTTTITLPHQRVATDSNTDVWNAEASIEVQAGRRSVDFELDTYTVDEGSNITVKVTLDADPLNTVEIPLTTEKQGDTSDADYSGVPASLTFNAGETEKTFTFLATDDNSAVDGKSVKIAIGMPLPDIIKPGTTFETTVTITDNVTDLNEAPLAPDAPTVSATSGSTTSLDVSWTAPTNTGRPSIDSYDLRYRVGDTGAWTKRPQNVVSTNTSIDNLASDTSYQVQVRAHNRDGNSPWSTSQTGTTGTTEENVLVSNTGQTVDGIGDPASFGAQSFSTGASNGGYTISEVRIRLNHVSPGATTLVSIREDNNGEPGDPVAILTNPASLTSDSVNTFTATAGTRLDPNTTYWITTNEGIVPTAFFALTVSYDETADAGWSIGNTRLYRFRETSTMIDRSSWIIGSKLLMIAIKGTAVGGASGDATLSALRVNDGTNDLTLTPAFASGTTDYTASVGNAVTTVTLTATVNHAGASVSAVTLNGTAIADNDFTDGIRVPSLLVGGNGIIVTVRAENGATQTYTVTVTRTTTTTDPAGVTVSETALTVVEENITGDNYTVVLDSLPTANVVITVAGHSGTDVTPTPTTLTFTTSDWDTAQTVTVTAGDDADTTSETVTLTHSAASTDSDYSGITIGNVTVTVSDNDTANTAPIFREGGSTSRAFNETIGDTAVSTASNIGAAVDASDRDTLTYSLEGIDQTKFGIIQTNGQIQTKVGERYSYEAQSSYSVTVRVVDGNSGSDTITVTLNVRDVDEQPARPAKPGVLGTAGTTNSLDVSWTKPDLAGGPEITGYNLHYRVMGQNTWIDETHSGTGTMATITGLNPGTEYEVEVQAKNGETPSAWSPTGNGSTGTTTTIDPGITVSPTALTVTEEDTTGDSYTVVLDSLPTANVVITVAGHAGTDVTPTPTSLAFTTSDWDTAQTVTVTAGSDADTTNETVTLTHSGASTDSNYQGITIGDVTVTVNDDDIDTTAGICGRTEEVRDGLVALMPGVSDCGAVTAADLAAIIGTLDLSNQSISDLKAGDFNGLTKLETLYLDNNDLTTLPAGVFDGLTKLETLALDNNDLSTLRGDVFNGLTKLETLYLNSNKLTTLPAGVFDGLTSLKVLTLYYNDLDTLPAGVFGPLTRLKVLYLSDNPGAAFAPTADALPDAGTVSTFGGTVQLDGSGSGGPWGTNVSYSWALTTPVSGVTFDDDTSAMPEVTIPVLAADTELTFTLTVTGRGGTDGIETATDTARVTATQNITNNPPVFADGTAQARTLAETVGDATVGTAADIGAAVNALGTDGDTLTYFLLGADPDKFTFDTSSGQIRTKVGESYDYEAQSSYSVTVAVTDGTVTVSAAVTLNVTDRNEPPLPLTTPVVTATQGSTPSLNVSWTQPSNPGRPDIDSYDLQYRVRNTGDFIDGPQDETGNSAPIGNLTANTEYEVQVRATNAEGDGVWSPSGTGTTSTTTTTDPAGVTVSETALTVVEENITGDNYTVVLDSLPTANVVITVAGHSGTDVTPTPTTLTFTTSDWDTAQTVTVTAGDDADTTSETVTLTHSAASTDSDYSGITIGNVTVTVSDNDTANTAPIFREGGSTSRAFNETIGDTAVSTASNIGAAVDASDRDTLTYSLEGIDQTKFGIIQTNGQIQTKVGERYSYEAQSSYSVTVRVVDGNSGSDTITVTLNVRDVDEQPARPAKPGVLGTAGTTNSLDVSWTKPDLAGGPEITGYNLHYRVMGQNTWIDETHSGTGTMATITGLNPGTEYEVEVQAKNGETPSAWSPTGNGSTGTTTTIDPGITVSPTALTVTEEDTTGDSYTVVLDSLPTANVVITVAGHAGTDVTPTPTSLAFTTSDWDTAQTVTVTAGSDADTTNETVTLTHSGASTDSNYQGITIGDVTVTVNDDDIDTTAGICGRTEEVRDGLVALMPGVSDCGAVTAADLAAIIGTLDLSNQSISDLKAGDFNGLTKLETLYLDNNDLTTLPAGVFDGLTKLETLALDNNDLSTLRGDVFNGLTKLETLYLNSNKLTTLPAGVFRGVRRADLTSWRLCI